MSTETKYKQMLQRLHTHENGPASDSLRKLGLPHKHIFGTGVNELKQLAAQIGNDNELALFSATKNVRESKLMAIYLCNATSVKQNELLQILKTADFGEFGEQAGVHLLHKLPFAKDLPSILLKSGNPFEKQTGLILLAVLAQRKLVSDTHYYEGFIAQITNLATSENVFVQKAVARALRFIGRLNLALHSSVFEWATGAKDNKIASIRQIAEEVFFELEYMKPRD